MKNMEINNSTTEVKKSFTNGRISYNESEAQELFVNEECGDTMWEAVLEQEERRQELNKILQGKHDTDKKIIDGFSDSNYPIKSFINLGVWQQVLGK